MSQKDYLLKWVGSHLCTFNSTAICYRNGSMGPVQIWWNITIVVNAVFEEILALTTVRHVVSSKRVIVQTKNADANNLWHICIVWKIEFSCQLHRQVTHYKSVTNSLVIYILCQPVRELSTLECHHLCRNTCSSYIQAHTFQDQYMKHIFFSFFQNHFIVQW